MTCHKERKTTGEEGERGRHDEEEGGQPKEELACADPRPSNHLEKEHDDGGKDAGGLHEDNQVGGLQVGSHVAYDHVVHTPDERNGPRILGRNQILRIIQQMAVLMLLGRTEWPTRRVVTQYRMRLVIQCNKKYKNGKNEAPLSVIWKRESNSDWVESRSLLNETISMQEKAMLSTPSRIIFLSPENNKAYGETIVPWLGRLLDFLNTLQIVATPQSLLQSVVLPFSVSPPPFNASFHFHVSSLLFHRLFC